ncbi:MAG: hypothetical protein ACRBF0_07745 [Calditrichia bacterium]
MNGKSILLMFIMTAFFQTPAAAQWKTVKRYIQPAVRITHESQERLVIYHEALDDSIILSTSYDDSCDIYLLLAQKRGGNPYIVWVTTINFWSNPRRSKRVWVKFFSSRFVSILRPPAELGMDD